MAFYINLYISVVAYLSTLFSAKVTDCPSVISHDVDSFVGADSLPESSGPLRASRQHADSSPRDGRAG